MDVRVEHANPALRYVASDGYVSYYFVIKILCYYTKGRGDEFLAVCALVAVEID